MIQSVLGCLSVFNCQDRPVHITVILCKYPTKIVSWFKKRHPVQRAFHVTLPAYQPHRAHRFIRFFKRAGLICSVDIVGTTGA